MIPSFPTNSPLVGRERELRLLHDALATTLAGHGSLILIGGEAGVGKTTLAEDLCGAAVTQGARILIGRCYDLTETPPYGPWVELFRQYQRNEDGPMLPPVFAERGTVGNVTSQAALFQQVQEFFTTLAAQSPLVLLLDDLHWSDPGSLDLLRVLARSVATLPLLLIVTYRADELTRRHPLYTLLPLLERESGAIRLDLRRFSPDAVRAMVAARYPLTTAESDRLVTYLDRRAEGNAFFTSQLLRALEEEGAIWLQGDAWTVGNLDRMQVPVALRQVIDGRLTRLGDEAQRLLAVAAVIGQEIPFALWATATESNEEGLLDVVEQAAAARIVEATEDGTRVRFVHALIREALYEGISPARRRGLDRRIGELLAAQPHPDPDAVAMHFERASDRRAVEWLVRAGERAQLAYAWLTAIERYESALALLEGSGEDVTQQGWLRYRIARLRRLSTPRQGVEYLDEALRIADAVGDRALAAAARYSRGLCLSYETDYPAAIRDMSTGCDALEALPSDEQARLDLAPDERGVPTVTNPRGYLVAILATCGHIAEATAMGEVTSEGMPRHTPLGELAWAHHGDRLGGLGTAYALAGRPDAARDAFTGARETLRTLGNHSTFAGMTTMDLLHRALPYHADRPDECQRLADEATAARARASASTARYTGPAFLSILALTGRWTEARVETDIALQSDMSAVWRVHVHPVVSELARRQGETGAAWTSVRAVLASGALTAPGEVSLLVGLALLRTGIALHLDADDLPNAREWLEAHNRWLAWSGAILGQSEGQALWSQYYRQAGDIEKAHEHAGRALAHATEPRQPLALLAAHRLLGELDTDAHRFDDARTHLKESLALADACHAPYERALTLLAMAEFHAAMDESGAARTLLDDVRAICEPLGAKPALARAAALAARLSATKSVPPAYPAGLSPREVEVLRFVAAGLTNPQVAERLFLSPRTVEQHLRSIYNKLGVNTRAAATHFAVTNGLA